MGLSKKNLGKLNTFIKNNNLVSKNNPIKKPQEFHNASKVEDPSKIFYSIIDNSDNINETCLLYTSPSPRDKRQSRMPSSA